MVMLAEHYDFVIGGDPDRDTIDLAILEAGTGRVRAQTADRTDGPAYARLLAWARQHAPGRRVWALEGTSSFAAGFVTILAEAGEDIVEIPGQKRSRRPKNDRIDAIQAARTALAQTQQAAPRERGLREALRQVLVTRQGVLVSRTKAINELKSLIVVAPEHLRSQLRGLPVAKQLDRIDRLTSPVGATIEHRVTISTLRSIAARIRFLINQAAELDVELLVLVPQHPAGPALLAEAGVGPVVAAQLLVSWSHRGRVRNEAARTRRTRSRGGGLTNIGASNGLLRQYFPKSSDLSAHSAELNDRPRKRLGFKKPRSDHCWCVDRENPPVVNRSAESPRRSTSRSSRPSCRRSQM